MDNAQKRRNYFIDRKFQTAFMLKFCGVVLVSSCILVGVVFWLAQDSTTVAIENTRVVVKRTSDFLLPVLSVAAPLAAAAAALVVLAMTLFYTHKIAGPLYRLRREIDQIKKGDLNRHFILRAEDQLQSLAHSLEEMNSVLLSKSKELKSRWQELDRYLTQKNIAAEERETINKMKQEIETVLNYFKS